MDGIRLAFAQGGQLGTKLVYVSPPVKVVRHGKISEATWQPARMPFRYSKAPLLIAQDGRTDFPLLRRFLKGTNRDGWLERFSSRFRSRRRPLETKISEELMRVYKKAQGAAQSSTFARHYVDALPYLPPKVDRDRESTYSDLLAAAREQQDHAHLSSEKRDAALALRQRAGGCARK